MSAAIRPEITDFLDIVDYLNSHYQWRKSTHEAFSYSVWQEELGLGSRTLLRLILRRQRKISAKTALVLKSNLNLSLKEQEYFDILLAYTQARSQSERKSMSSSLTRLQRKLYNPLPLKSSIGTHVLKPVVLALMTYKDMSFTENSLSELLNVEKEEIQKTLESLLSEKIISMDKNGIFHFAAEVFKVPDTLGSSDLKAYYRYWLDKAKEALDWPVETRRYKTLQFALSSEEFVDIQTQINEFAGQLLGNYKSTSMNGRRLYMLESVLMPLSKEFKKPESEK